MARDHTVTKLSKSILEMKFMKKTREKVEKEQEDKEGRQMYSHEITAEMRRDAGCFIMEPSFVPCEDLLVGRLSYRGMNPEIERIMELENADCNELLEKQKETDISDREMAAHYNPLVNTMNSKFKKRTYDQFQNSSFRGKNNQRNNSNNDKESKRSKYSNDNEDSPSVHHKNKKFKFMKPKD